MKFILLFSILLLFKLQAFTQVYPQKLWDKTIGGYYLDQSSFSKIKTTKDGNLLFIGSAVGPGGNLSTASNGGWDYWFFKMDTLGNLLWEAGFGGSNDDEGRDFLELKDGGFILVGSSFSPLGGDKTEFSRGGEDFWIVRIDSSRNILWDKTFGGITQDRCQAVIQTPDAGFMVVGHVKSPLGFDVSEPNFGSNNNDDFWVIRIDSLGNKIWDKRYGWDGAERCNTILSMSDGNYLLIGWTGSAFAGGHISLLGKSVNDFWVLKIDSQGNKIWDKRYGSEFSGQNYENYSALNTPDGGFIFMGQSTGDAGNDKTENSRGLEDFWILKCDSLGNKLWDKTLGGDNTEFPGTIIDSGNGSYIVCGSTKSSISGEKTQTNWSNGIYDYWAVKISNTGTKIWDVRFGGTGIDACLSATSIDNGKYILYGNSYSDISGDKTENNWNLNPGSNPNGDLWLVAFSEPPLGYENMGDSKGGLDVFPNPFRETLEVGAEWSGAGKVQLELYDITGRKVFESDYTISTPFFNKEIELGFLPAGVYSLTLVTASEKRTRLVVKR